MFKIAEDIMKKIEAVLNSNTLAPAYGSEIYYSATPPCSSCINSCSGGCRGTCTATCARRTR